MSQQVDGFLISMDGFKVVAVQASSFKGALEVFFDCNGYAPNLHEERDVSEIRITRTDLIVSS